MDNTVTDSDDSKRRTTTCTIPEGEDNNCDTQYFLDYAPLEKSALSRVDCDLSRNGHEDAVICELVLWLHKCERYMGIDPETALVNHDRKELSSTVGFTPAYPLYVGKFPDGHFAVSYHADGPYALLPQGFDVLAIRRDHECDVILVRYQ